MDIFGITIPLSVSDLKDDLNSKIADVQAKVGVFLQQKQRLMQLSQRASALSKLPQSASWSTPLIASAQQLLDAQTQLEKDSARFVQDANNTMTQLQTDPMWIAAAQGIAPSISWDTVSKTKFMAETIVNVTKQLTSTMSRIDAHIANVDGLEAKVKAAEANSPMIRPALATASINYTPWLIGGALLLGGYYARKNKWV